MIHTLKSSLLYVLFLALMVFSACNPDVPGDEECSFDIEKWCGGAYSFSIVNADTYENLLIGDDRLIDPDKLVITNTRSDTMTSDIRESSDGWISISRFNPFQEIYCFDMCLSDSAFTRTYYLNYGGEDTDTIEIFFPERADEPIVAFNGIKGVERDEKPKELENQPHWSLYWFLKKKN